ncbi:MAG: ATP-binding protein [Deltaproteobacteria bacterium]|nr:ATP-binding protein [Deltaproteobacteria bacterium]
MPALTLPASLEQLATVNEYLRHRTPPAYAAILPRLQLAAEEILVNVCTYAYAGKTGQAEVDCRLERHDGQEMLCLGIKDWGPPFDPFTDAPTPDLDLGVDERPVGGLGIHLITTMAARHAYTRQDGANVVKLCFTAPE